MQGVLLDEMRQYLAERFGYRAWIETLRRSGHTVTYQFQLDQVYPDEELGLLARHAAEVTGTPPRELLKGFGEALVPDMIRMYSRLIEKGWSTICSFSIQIAPAGPQFSTAS